MKNVIIFLILVVAAVILFEVYKVNLKGKNGAVIVDAVLEIRSKSSSNVDSYANSFSHDVAPSVHFVVLGLYPQETADKYLETFMDAPIDDSVGIAGPSTFNGKVYFICANKKPNCIINVRIKSDKKVTNNNAMLTDVMLGFGCTLLVFEEMDDSWVMSGHTKYAEPL